MDHHSAPSSAGSSSRHDLRAAPRRTVSLPAHLRDAEQSRFDLEMTDVSAVGFRATTPFALEPEAAVWLTLPGLAPIEAKVTRRQAGQYACVFTRPLHPRVLEHLVAMGR